MKTIDFDTAEEWRKAILDYKNNGWKSYSDDVPQKLRIGHLFYKDGEEDVHITIRIGKLRGSGEKPSTEEISRNIGRTKSTAMLNLFCWIDAIDEQYNRACKKIVNDNYEIFIKSPASSHNHQSWPGGYVDHVVDTMRAGCEIYEALSTIRSLPFSLSDVMLVMFLHDLEKPWKYAGGVKFATKEERKAFRYAKIAEYGIELTSEHINALDYVEGEIHDYSNTERKMGQLAALCHMADIASARLWPEEKFGNNV